jgi:hypothetical protein
MNTIALSSRARTAGIYAAAGITALVGTLAVAGSAGASGPLAATADAARVTVSGEAYCNDDMPVGIIFAYDDLVDGHRPISVHENITDHTGVRWTRDELHQEDGDYFNTFFYPESANESQWIEPNATYTYSVTITYDDGVTQTTAVEVDLADACGGTAPSVPTAPADHTPRFEQSIRAICGSNGAATGIEVAYDDLVDGHVPQTVHEDLDAGGAIVWSSNELHQVNGDYFNRRQLSAGSGLATFDPNLSYGYTLIISYDDGAERIETVWITPSTACAAAPPTTSPATTVPGGTLPETGTSDITWIVGAVGGLFLTAGTALFAGTRRTRSGAATREHRR